MDKLLLLLLLLVSSCASSPQGGLATDEAVRQVITAKTRQLQTDAIQERIVRSAPFPEHGIAQFTPSDQLLFSRYSEVLLEEQQRVAAILAKLQQQKQEQQKKARARRQALARIEALNREVSSPSKTPTPMSYTYVPSLLTVETAGSYLAAVKKEAASVKAVLLKLRRKERLMSEFFQKP